MTTKIPTEYDPSKEELEELDEFFDRQPKVRPPSIKVSAGSKVQIDHAHQELGWMLLMKAFGTTNEALFNGLLKQIIDINTDGGRVDEPP